MANKEGGSGFSIPALVITMIGIIVGVSLIQPLTQSVSTITGDATTTTTTIASSIPAGTPLMPVNVTVFVAIDTLIICVLIGIWYFFHYKKRGK